LTLSGTSYGLFALATIFTLARVGSRWTRFRGDGFWLDDYAAFLAHAFLVALTASQALGVQVGVGKDLWGLELEGYKDVLYVRRRARCDGCSFRADFLPQWLYISNILWTPIGFFTKISLVFLYLRLWTGASRFRFVCLAALGTLLLGYFVFQVVTIAQCSPVSYFWNQIEDSRLVEAHLADAVQGSCIDQRRWLWASSALMVMFDLMMVFLPITKLFKSSLSRVEIVG
jgi:hypothetical protein